MKHLSLQEKNCGLCGENTCAEFYAKVKNGITNEADCPYNKEKEEVGSKDDFLSDVDIHGYKYDFMLMAVPGELSARKIIRPFRVDLIEKLNIQKGSIVMGRPMGAGCPVTHILEVYDVDELSGVLYTWAIGPLVSRDNDKVIDIKSYAMTGFEGIAKDIKVEPMIGKSAGFMPGFCMLRLTHYGLVNKLINTKDGLLTRLEDIHISR